jgi:hypothetical protein
MKYPETSCIPNSKEVGEWRNLNFGGRMVWCKTAIVQNQEMVDGHQGQTFIADTSMGSRGSWGAADLLMKMQDDSCQKMCKGKFIHVKITKL